MVSFSPLLLCLLWAAPLLVSGFVNPATITTRNNDASTTSVARNLLVSPEGLSDALTSSTHFLSLQLKETSADMAKSQFFILFFAGSGGGGIGLAQIPKIVKEFQLIRTLAKEGPTDGGDTLPTNPLVSLFYPKKLAIKDVQKVLSKIPSAAKINAQGASTSYFATKGYVVQDDFLQALTKAKCNPLASYAAFQAVSKGSGKCVSPDDVDDRLAAYKADAKSLGKFTADLQSSVVTKVSSYVALAFLLFVTFDLIIETGFQAFG